MSFSIEGKTAIVTGAADHCGLEIGRHFLEQGARVVFADANEVALERHLSHFDNYSENMRIFSGNLCKKLTIANLLSATLDDFERVDILVNGARYYAPSDALDGTKDEVKVTLDHNVVAPLRMAQAVAKQMIKQARETDAPHAGSIINMSSISATHTGSDLLAFSTSSAAIDQVTRSLAVSFAPMGVRVNGIALGSMKGTSLDERLYEDETLHARVVKSTPMERLGHAREAAHTAQYLASDAASFVAGQIIAVDGGRSLLDPLAVLDAD